MILPPLVFPGQTKVGHHSVTKYVKIIFTDLVKNKAKTISSFRCDKIYKYKRYDFGHTLLCLLNQTCMFKKLALEARGGFVGTSQQSVTKFISMIATNLCTPKAATKLPLSCSIRLTKFILISAMELVEL